MNIEQYGTRVWNDIGARSLYNSTFEVYDVLELVYADTRKNRKKSSMEIPHLQ